MAKKLITEAATSIKESSIDDNTLEESLAPHAPALTKSKTTAVAIDAIAARLIRYPFGIALITVHIKN